MAENTSLPAACCAFPNQSLAVSITLLSFSQADVFLCKFLLLFPFQIVTKSLPVSCRPLPDPQDLWEVLQWYQTLPKLKLRICFSACTNQYNNSFFKAKNITKEIIKESGCQRMRFVRFTFLKQLCQFSDPNQHQWVLQKMSIFIENSYQKL